MYIGSSLRGIEQARDNAKQKSDVIELLKVHNLTISKIYLAIYHDMQPNCTQFYKL